MFSLLRVRHWFVVSLVKAIELKSDLRSYKFEKKLAKAGDGVEDEEDDKHFELRNIFGFISTSFQHSKKNDHGTDDFSVFHKLLIDGTTENFVLKSALGFLGGILLTYVCYLFLIYSLNFTLRRATLICIGLSVILSLGLAFSVRIRCTVLLCIPQLFSKRGRQALLAYAFILALSGPAKNTLHNVEVMSESLACGQEQLKKAENELLKCVHRPNTAVKQSLERMLIKLDYAVKGYKNFIESFYKECQAAVSSAADWTRACGMSKVQDHICPTKDEPICSVEDLPPFWPFLNLRKQLNDLRKEAMNVLYVKIETHQIFTQPNRTATLHEEYQGMATEIRQKTDQFLQYFDVMSVILGIFILVLFIKVIIYRYKFLTEDEYDNRFITSDFVDIDKTRAEFRMQTLLPLEPRERKKYIRVTSMRLVPYERERLFSSFIFLMFATFKIIIHMLTDCSLYWMLSTMRRHGRMLLISSDKDSPQVIVTVDGSGLFAELLRNVTRTVRPYAVQQILDPIPCLPDPISPDWNRYCQILTLVLICWFLAFCEPYGLRLRHIVMVTYHPDRARERAIWLYNRILTTRINFVKFARRQLRRRYKDVDEDAVFRPHLWIIRRRLQCLLCKEDLKEGDYIKCPSFGCVGIYCKACFVTLQLCSICKDPSYYGDYSDVSEEKDSEEEDERISCCRCRCLSMSKTYLRRKPVEEYADYYMFQMTYDPVPYVRNLAYPKFQISMDTIVDVDEDGSRHSGEPKSEEKTNNDAPVMSPSILTRLMHQCKKAFGGKNMKTRTCEETSGLGRRRRKAARDGNGHNVYFFSTMDDTLKKTASIRASRTATHQLPLRDWKSSNKRQTDSKGDYWTKRTLSSGSGRLSVGRSTSDDKSRKATKKFLQLKRKEPLTVRAFKGLTLFKWKLRDKLSEGITQRDPVRVPGNSSESVRENLRSVYVVDMDAHGRTVRRCWRSSSDPQGKIQQSSTSREPANEARDDWNLEEGSQTCNEAPKTSTSCQSSSRSRRNVGNSKNTERRSEYDVLQGLPRLEDFPHCPVHGPLGVEVLRTSSGHSRISLPVIERWKHPRFRVDDSQRKYLQKLDLERSGCFRSVAELLQISSSGEYQHTGLTVTDKETQTQPTDSDVQESSTVTPQHPPLVEYFKSGGALASQENQNSSSPSSSTYDAIRKQLIDAKRRRQKSRESIKSAKFERRSAASKRIRRCSTRYETTSDSSAEAKQMRWRRTKSRKPRLAITMTDADIILTNSAQKVLSKKVDMMKAKLANFFRRSIKRQSSSDEGGSTEADNEEFLPITTAFLSEDEFPELSGKFNENKSEDGNKKSISCAPDLLSDLPSSKTPASTGGEVLPECHAESDLDYDDCR